MRAAPEVGRAASPVTLRRLSTTESIMIIDGRQRDIGVPWESDYPTVDTMIAVQLLIQAYEALGMKINGHPPWWLLQIMIGGRVVGDIGFHGPPDDLGVVEIGYCVVPSWRRRGVATTACRMIIGQAREQGARVIAAEVAVDNLASRAVLRSAGFLPVGDERFELQVSGSPG